MRLPASCVTGLLAALLAALFLWGTPKRAVADVAIDITRGSVAPLPIAVTAFAARSADSQGLGLDITQVVTADLERSGLFEPIDPEAFIQGDPIANGGPRFADWRLIGAQALTTGAVTELPGGRIRVDVQLWDPPAARQLDKRAFTTTRDNWRRVAHIVADAIYQRLTGEPGYFDTRILYVAESGPKRNRTRRLAIMDQDGANHRYLTDGSFLALAPNFSPTGQRIAYLRYENRRPHVFLFDAQTGRQEKIGVFQGLSFAPRFSPDGASLLMSYATGANMDIFVMSLGARRAVRLTTDPGIDTSPSFSPDGKQIVFNSDRGGRAQLYIMNTDGSAARRITFSRGRYTAPVWSPRGDWIAFTKQQGGVFSIGVMRPDGTGERLLTESFLDEGPSWSPNGRVILFSRQEPGVAGRTRLYAVDLTGANLREVLTPGDGSAPSWSPPNR